MPIIDRQALRDAGLSCIYDRNRLAEERVRGLLAADASELFRRSEPLTNTSQAATFKVHVDGECLFAKEMFARDWYHRLCDRLTPAAFRNFWAAGRLLRANLLTPPPLLAAVIADQGRQRQLLVTDFCEAAVELDAYVERAPAKVRAEVILELADVLTDFHQKGFYSRHLRSGNILVREREERRDYYFVDLDRMSRPRFRATACFVSTVTRACAEFYGFLGPEERHYLLVTCFDFALKKNVFTKPSQQGPFMERAIAQIRRRNESIDSS